MARPWADPAARGEEAEIYRTWMHYLSSKSGRYAANAASPSPLWALAEQERWPVYDLAALYLPDGATPEVLSIEREPGLEGQYRIVTAFHADNTLNSMRSRLVRMTAFAVRSDSGWRIGNALPRLTRSWRHDTVGPLAYVIEPGYRYDRERAARGATFIDSLATALDLPRLDRVTYYLASSSDEVYRIIGLETDTLWGPVGGVSQPVNRQLFSGIPSLGEEYRHELTHVVIMPLLMGHPTPYIISEGVPTWLGGTTGMDFPTAAAGLARFLTENPGITLDTLLTRPFPVAQFYPAGAVFVDMAYACGGTAGVKALFDAGTTTPELRKNSEHLFKKPWAAIATDWRRRTLQFLPDQGTTRPPHHLPCP